jgi:hypothetical protein
LKRAVAHFGTHVFGAELRPPGATKLTDFGRSAPNWARR